METGSVREDLDRYREVTTVLETTQSELEELESSEALQVFRKQLGLLRKRLLNDPKSLRQVFIDDGTHAIIWEFRQEKLGAAFTRTLWELLLRGDDMSTILQRFVWALPLKFKRKFVAALDAHLSERYPMFKGLSKGWPAENYIPPYVRPAEQRAHDFDLVTMGYLGYRTLGYSQREVDLFVWLEVMRDKQCEDRPCEVGVLLHNRKQPKGGCPVKIHIPEMMDLLGTGRFKDALKLIESCNPLPNVTGRVCPQELQCQGVCTITGRPIEIGQLEWYLPERERLNAKENGNSQDAAEWKDYVTPWQKAEKPPIAVVGSGPAGLINAYLLSVEGFPVTVFEAFHDLGGVLRYGIPEFRLPNALIDDVVGKIDRLGGKFVKNFVVGKTATLQDLRNAGFWKIFVGTGAGLPRFMNVPGEELNGVMSANEFLTRVNLMQGRLDDYETPLPMVKGKKVIVIGAGNTAMDSARTSLRLGGDVTIVYRRTRAEMPVRVEELHHALEEGVKLKVLRAPSEFSGNKRPPRLPHHPRRDGAGPAGCLRPPLAGAHRRNRDDGSRSRHHGARQLVEPDHQGLRTAHQDHQVGHHRPAGRLVAGDLAGGHLLGRRCHPRRFHRDQRGRRRQGGGEPDRRRDPVQPGRDQGPRRNRPRLHREGRGARDPAQEDGAVAGHRRVHGQRPGDRPFGPGRPVRPRPADAEGRAHPAHPGRLGRHAPAPSTSSSRASASAPS